MADPDPAGPARRRIVWAGVLLAAFLAGFLLQAGAARQARSVLKEAETELARLRQQAAQAEVRDLAALVLFEVTQRNFGTASQHSTALFDRLQRMTADGAADARLAEALSARDRITAGLTSADPGVLGEVQRVFQLVFAATARGS